MAETKSLADLVLHPIGAAERPLATQVKLFNLALIAVDPYTNESSWLLPTAVRILDAFAGADLRVGWLITADEYDAKAFLGPLAERFITFTDRDREAVKALGIERLPAFIHIDANAVVADMAQDWDPPQWRDMAHKMADFLSWKAPAIPKEGDPIAFTGSPAQG